MKALEHLETSEREDLSVFLVRRPRFAGPSPLIPCGEALGVLTALPPQITLVALVTDPAVSLAPMLELVVRGEVGAASHGAPVSEAVKAVRDGWITRSVDRERFVVVTGPEVVQRSALMVALRAARSDDWANATALVARSVPVSVTVSSS